MYQDPRVPLIGALALNLVGIMPAAVPTGQQVFRSQARVVPVYAVVRAASGQLVTGLTKDDFRVLDDGEATEIVAFAVVTEPVSVAIMMDASASGQPSGSTGAAFLRRAIVGFVSALDAGDRASLGTFGTEVAVGGRFSNDLDEFNRVLEEEFWTGLGVGSPIWQAAGEAAATLGRRSGRRVVLLYTDGSDSGFLPNWRGGRASVERQLLGVDAMVYVIRPRWSQRRTGGLPADLIDLIQSTGGGHLDVMAGADLEAVLAGVADELRHQYLIGFTPRTLDRGEHTVELRTVKPGLTVTAPPEAS
jgi:Ca-activated chloride channel family protein